MAIKTFGVWRPIISLSDLNKHVNTTRFKMETLQSVLRSLCLGDWMVSIDLKEACLQIPIHPDSCKFLRFGADGGTFQFKVLLFSITTAPQVFTWVMAPISVVMHRQGFRILCYLDNWLILASSQEEIIRVRDFLLQLCLEFGTQTSTIQN